MSKKAPEYLKKAVWLDQMDKNNTVLIDVGEKGFRVIPQTRRMVSRLVLLERKLGESMDYMLSNLDYEQLVKDDFDFNKNPVINLLNSEGIQVALTTAANNRLENYKKEIHRFTAPFKFYVPDEFDDLGNKKNSEIQGPFVEDLFKDEIHANMESLRNMGLLDKTKDFHLHRFQAWDVARLAVKRYGYIGHEQGLGKTPMAVALGKLHNYKWNLVIAPPAAIGSFTSGWRHEIHRMGIPKDHIHLLDKPEDLPSHPDCQVEYKDDGIGHWFLVDYNTLAKDKWEYNAFDCPKCHNPVPAKNKGNCKDPSHKQKWLYTTNRWGQKERNPNPHYIEAMRRLTHCPVCAKKARLQDPNGEVPSSTVKKLKEAWTGNLCDPKKGGCGWRLKFRVLPAGREKKGFTDKLPIWKRIPRGFFGCVFIDESHLIKNIKSKRSLAVQMIRGPRRLYIMTGTMMTNYVEDTFWQLQRLCPAGLFPIPKMYKKEKLELVDYFAYQTGTGRGWQASKTGYNYFLDKFQGAKLDDGGKISSIRNVDDFWRMMSCFMVRRKSDDPDVTVDINLPPLNLHTEMIEMDPLHRTIYRSMTGEFQREIIASVKKANNGQLPDDFDYSSLGLVNESEVKQRMMVLRQIAACPDQDATYNKDMTTKDIRMLELIEQGMKKDEKTVIFCSFNDHIIRLEDLLKDKGIPVMTITGKTSKANKWALIDEWRTSDKHWVLLTSMKVLSEAVNLTPLVEDFKINRIIFGSPDWVPATMAQAIKRIHRIGQPDPVQAYYLWHKGTIEEKIDELLLTKKQVISMAMDRTKYEREDEVTQLSAIQLLKSIMTEIDEDDDEQ